MRPAVLAVLVPTAGPGGGGRGRACGFFSPPPVGAPSPLVCLRTAPPPPPPLPARALLPPPRPPGPSWLAPLRAAPPRGVAVGWGRGGGEVPAVSAGARTGTGSWRVTSSSSPTVLAVSTSETRSPNSSSV